MTTIVSRPNGRVLSFFLTNGVWKPDVDIADTLVQLANASGWIYTTADGTVETYNASGARTSYTNLAGITQTTILSDGTTGPNGGYLLDASGNPTATVLPANYGIRVTDTFGRSLSFGYGYDSTNTLIRFVKMVDPAGGIYRYTYDGNNNLTQVTYPGGKTKQYLYGEAAYISASPNPGVSNAHALTGIIDENGVRHASYWYDAQGRAYKEELAPGLNQGIGKYTMTYTTDAVGNPISTAAIDPLNTVRTYNFSDIHNTAVSNISNTVGVPKSTGQSQPGGSGCGASSNAMTYDANGNVASRTDFNGNLTTYIYDLSRNLETSRTEAVGKPEARTITTTWHPTFRLPASITEPGRVTTFNYDGSGNLLKKTVTDGSTTRSWSTTYNAVGQVLTVTGPRTDVVDITRYDYDPSGNLTTITNAAGHVTILSNYDANGRARYIVDPNGLITELVYHPRGWLLSRNVGGELTLYDYDDVGQLKTVTLPDNSTISYTYDPAHRLTDIADSLGNTIHYTLDAIGNRISEQVKDPGGTLARQTTRIYDSLNRLQQITGGQQ